MSVFDSTVVRVETDAGLAGHGEVCPLGPVYLPAYAAGVRAGLRGARPASARRGSRRSLDKLNRRMDAAQGPSLREVGDRHRLLGHPGQAAGLPVCVAARRPLRRGLHPLPRHLAGAARGDGREGRRLSGARAIAVSNSRSAATPTTTSSASGRVRAVLEPGDELVADANTGWLMHDAVRVVNAVRDVDVYIEQPCASYERVPRGSPPHAAARSCSTRVIDSIDMLAARRDRPRDGRGQPQDQQARRPDAARGRPATCASRSASP